MRTGKMMAMKRVCLQTMNQRLWSNQPNDLSSSFGTDVRIELDPLLSNSLKFSFNVCCGKRLGGLH